ncbi:DoxX family protein [Novosphingobium malaysiense]|uniref:DoxX protein n=1 Tax=Novosphingobium malaysiense TaxID=1348853 RepID=A0A0B1ZI79_9SPHN|nr:DoxX family protein [Novosphingobium malaysiense]KHK90207.1 DoxX protein [Novosphingobium malaysiense]
MERVRIIWGGIVAFLRGSVGEGVALAFVRLALAGVFWRSGRSKVVEGTWLQLSDGARYLFENDYSGVPLPADMAANIALVCETVLPILLVLGLATRLSALALLGMTMTIQIFVFPDAWWSVHILWVALALTLVSRGSGMFAVDAVAARWFADDR